MFCKFLLCDNIKTRYCLIKANKMALISIVCFYIAIFMINTVDEMKVIVVLIYIFMFSITLLIYIHINKVIL